MAGLIKKVVRFYTYPILRPLEQIGGAIKSTAETLKEVADNGDQSSQLSFKAVLDDREAAAKQLDEKFTRREAGGRRMGVFLLSVFLVVCLVGLYGLVVSIAHNNLIEAKNNAVNFLIGLFICAGGAIWGLSFSAERKLPSMDELLRQLVFIKRLLVVMLTIAIGVLIVNVAFLRFGGALLSLASISLILAYNFRYSLRIAQIRRMEPISAKKHYQEEGLFCFFNLEIS